ncbi:MAG: alpha/beta fold hydrolase [Planctomycetota bacterium]
MGKRTPSGFFSAEGEEEYLSAYDATLAAWPVPFDSLFLSTRFGSTHVIASGPKEAQPLVLLHAASLSASEWVHNVAELSRRFRTYAVDILGDPGKSLQIESLQGRSDVSQWLLEVLGELGIERAFLCGHSYGGWMTVSLALDAPHRLRKIALLAPAASVYPLAKPVLLSLRTGRFQWMLPTRLVVSATLRGLFTHPEKANEAFLRQFGIGVKRFRFPKGATYPSAYTDEELQRLVTPTLLLIGSNELIYPPQKALARAKRLIPDLQTELIPDAGHALNIDQPELVSSRVLEFFSK